MQQRKNSGAQHAAGEFLQLTSRLLLVVLVPYVVLSEILLPLSVDL
jgi:hypothetical protein